MEYVLQTTNLTKRYGSTPALSQLNLHLPAGQVIGLLGTNGSGKTTLLKLCAGLLTPHFRPDRHLRHPRRPGYQGAGILPSGQNLSE